MALWLKHEATLHGTYTVPEINTIPTGVQGVAIVTGILSTSLCMVYPIWTTFTFATAVLLFSNVVLLVWDIPTGLHFTAYYLLGMTSCITPILFPWVNMIMKDDAEARAFTTGAMVSLEIFFLSNFSGVSRISTNLSLFSKLTDDLRLDLLFLLSNYGLPRSRGTQMA
jgi:hypothetical protein